MAKCRCQCSCACSREPGIISSFFAALGEGLLEVERAKSKAKDARQNAIKKYHGTRVVKVALRIYVNFWGGRRKKDFWYEWDERQKQIFEFAAEELRNDPHSWGPFYWLVSIAQVIIVTPIRGLLNLMFILRDKNLFAPIKIYGASCFLYDKIIDLERNWNRTPYKPTKVT